MAPNLTAKTLLQRMPEVFDEEAAGDTHATVQYNLTEPMYQVLDNGTLQVYEGSAENPDLIITMSDEDMLELFRGNLNGMTRLYDRSGQDRGRHDAGAAAGGLCRPGKN